MRDAAIGSGDRVPRVVRTARFRLVGGAGERPVSQQIDYVKGLN